MYTTIQELLNRMDEEYVQVSDITNLHWKEKYRQYTFGHSKSLRDQFLAMEHLERVAKDFGVNWTKSDKAALLLSRLDKKQFMFILNISITLPDLTKDYLRMKEVLIYKWDAEVQLRLHREHKDNHDVTSQEQVLYGGSVGKGKNKKREEKVQHKRDNKHNFDCYNCGKSGHRAKFCPSPRTKECEVKLEADRIKYKRKTASATATLVQITPATPTNPNPNIFYLFLI
jgi:hypothetical protein